MADIDRRLDVKAFRLEPQRIGTGKQAGAFAGPALRPQPLPGRRKIARVADRKLIKVFE